jgi:hypothetical protein
MGVRKMLFTQSEAESVCLLQCGSLCVSNSVVYVVAEI